MNKINFNLPEFVFLDGNTPDGDTLENRTVILHVRSNTMMEVICIDEMHQLILQCQTFPFDYKNQFGIVEKHLLAVHYSFADNFDKLEIFERTIKWYCDYLTWEDNNIIEGETSKHN